MVNFRFHLVSLTAVFFALALGVTVGATVLRRTTVDTLEGQVSRVEQRLDETDQENAALREELALRDRFAEEAGDRLVQGRLAGVPVVLIGADGVDRTPVDAMRASLASAGATLESVVWFREKVRLVDEDSARELAEILGLPVTRPEVIQRQLYERLAAAWTGGTAPGLLTQLQEAGFIELELGTPAATTTVPDAVAPAPTVRRFVIISSVGATVGHSELALPLTEELVRSGDTLLLAVEAGEEGEDGFEAGFVTELRATEAVAGRLSTVDNLGKFIGRIAAVLALEDLGSGRLGHYGVAAGAERLVPAPTG